jgi:hypothetical protein
MERDIAKDDLEFKCNRDSELDYVASLYEDKIIVKAFLTGNCKIKSIKYFTYLEIYQLIEKVLGLPVPGSFHEAN